MTNKKELELYVHIPFCRQKCLYCDFLSAPAGQETISSYLSALEEQIRQEGPDYEDRQIVSVFFGGGTPSLLSGEQLGRLTEMLYRCFRIAPGAEITLESNPGTLDFEKLCACRQAGVNRLSMGLQSADDGQLRRLGRIHSFADFVRNYEQARRAGFANISVDLMSALPGQSVDSWLDTLKKTAQLGPEHISAYSLIIEEGTPFWDWYGETEQKRPAPGKGLLPLPTEEEDRRMYACTQSLLEQYGYRRYEISNYARKGYACRHNIGYWRRADYLGLGLGASSLVDNVRWKNTSKLDRYLQDCREREEVQRLSAPEQMEEFMFLGLRLTEGVSAADFEKAFGTKIEAIYGPVLERLERQGLLVFSRREGKLRLTPYGVDVSNYAMAQFLLDSPDGTEGD